MASAAADDDKRPMSPEEEPTDATAAAETKPSSASEPEVGDEEKKREQAQGGEGAEGDGDGDGELVLVTECGTELRLSRCAARMSSMLLGMMEGGCAGGRIAIPGVHAGILRMVAAYCEKHAPHYDPVAADARDRDPFPPFTIDLTPATHRIKPVTEPDPDPHGLKAWDQEFISAGVDNSTLFAIIIAANYMGIEDLIDLGCTVVADKMRGKTPEEIRDAFEIENDYTPEQEAEVRKANAWAFED
ncbi:SKP1-like protein 5 [Phragmites australis]|uniref:SKP1-like protein 5 n=1 Tax=Phragmites australis TaxID=29695 RepID=UPI002D7939CA|nr:SKP1-like protein 5 [Phragmites australis]